MQNPECGLQTAGVLEYGMLVRNAESASRIRNASPEYGMQEQNTECKSRMRDAECRMQAVCARGGAVTHANIRMHRECRVQSAECKIVIMWKGLVVLALRRHVQSALSVGASRGV